MKTICKKLIGAAVIAVLLGVNYGASAVAAEMNHHGMISTDLRTGLNSLFREHVFLAAWATGAALAEANPNLPKETVADLVKGHVLTLKDVIDAQASGDTNKSFMAIRSAAGHMGMIADPLAAAIVKQFPDRFASR